MTRYARTAGFLLSLALVAGFTQPSVAGTPGADELARTRQQLARAAVATKGTHRQLLELEQRRLARLIDDLEQGRVVNPAEVSRAVERAEQLAR